MTFQAGKGPKKETVIHRGKSRIWAGSIAAAFLAAIAVFTVMMQMEKNLLTQYEKGCILKAAVEIPKGQMITKENRADYFVQAELDKSCIPDTAFVSLEQLENMVPAVSIEPGALVTKGMFEEMNEITAQMREPVIAGFKAEDLFQVAGGILRAGDRIHIYKVNEEGLTSLVWSDVFVQEVFDQSGTAIKCGDKESAAQRVNVYLDKQDVEQFYSELSEGSLRAVKVWE